MLYGQSFSETIMTAQGDGVAISAAAATTLLPASAKAVVPANWWQIGKKIRITAWGRISSVITSPGTARFDIRVGSSVVFDSLAILLDTVAAHVNVGWKLEVELTVRSIGTAATVFGQGTWTCEDILGTPASSPKAAVIAILPWNSAPAVGATFDSTINQILDMFFTQTLATGSCQLHQYEVELKN